MSSGALSSGGADGAVARAVWITWEHHRRSTELAAALGVPLKQIVFSGPRPVRHLLAALATLATLARERPRLVFVQNPSIFLAALACAVKRLFGCVMIVDRHSNFRFENTDTGVFNLISNYSLRAADLTIVTNAFVAKLVESKGGRPFVLPDRLPRMSPGPRQPLDGAFRAVYVCTFSPDEPFLQVVEAARLLDGDMQIYVTGNADLMPEPARRAAPPNVTFTGFLSDHDYETLLASADVVMELTMREHTLLCGAYEAVSLGKPLVTSSTAALAGYFSRGVVSTTNDPTAIAAALTRAQDQLPALRREIVELARELRTDWDKRFARLRRMIDSLDRGALARRRRRETGRGSSVAISR